MIPYPVIEAAVKVAVHGNFWIQDAVNEVIRQLFGDQLARSPLHQLRSARGQAVTKTATTVPMWMKNFADVWKQN